MLEWLCMLCHIFHLSSYCVSMLIAYFNHSRTSICCFDCLAFLFRQMDGQECLRTSFSYLCFSRLKLYSCYITKFDQVRFEPLCVRSTRSPRFVIDLNFQNLSVHFGMTDPSTLVTPSSLSWSRFSISVQPIWTFRSHRVAVTTCDSASRCHWVVPLGHTNRVMIYIYPQVRFWKFLQNLLACACPALPHRVSGSSSHRQRPLTAGFRRCQRDSTPPLPP